MGLTNCLSTYINMKVYAILERREDYEIEISKIFRSRKKARKYILEKYYTGCELTNPKILHGVDSWMSIRQGC